MGLIKAGVGALSGTLADSWKEFIYCDSLPETVLMTKGQKRISGRSSNTKGEENIITNGSRIAVNEGQCMLIVEQGKVVDFCAEAGEYTYDMGTEPSLFSGGFGEGIINTFKTIGKRFTFGGDTGKDQRVYYINTKEIMGNKYGTPAPVPFRVVDKNIGLDVDISVRCNGEYSYIISDPLIFYTKIAANVTTSYTRDRLDSQLKSELMTSLQPAFARISEMGIRYSALPGHTTEIANALNEILTKEWREDRGISVAHFGINMVKASEEDEQMIKDLQRTAVMRDPTMAAATLVTAQGDAMKTAAGNQGGAMMGFMGLNMAQQAGGFNAQNLYAMGQQNQMAQQAAQQAQQPADGWTCKCGKVNTGKFCMECGSPKPAAGWKYTNCGAQNEGKFCMECGTPAPVGKLVCDKCGFELDTSNGAPKFCPNCGDKVDGNDRG